MSRIVACFALAFIATGCASLPYTPVVIPWHVGEATHRQIVEVRSPIPRTSPVVDLELNAREGDLLRLIDLNQPEIPLPVFRSGRRVSVRLPEAMDPIHRIAVYWTRTALSAPSPLLDARPFSGDDYATTTHNDTWDFDEGDQDGIRSWGDRPHHYGPITVKGGVLNVPVTGNDPYCIWGVMFGNLDDQPPGHTGSPAESIDTALYSVLRMRLRQSCPEATWTVFFTDKKGRYQKTEFEVKGTAFQTLELNLTDLFPNFWDGRTMRAFRLDTTNDQVGATVEIDWVRIERGIPDITLGPPLSRDAIRQRDPAASFQASCPPTATAGTEAEFVIRDAKGKDDATPSPNPPFTCELRTLEGEVVAAVNDTVRARTDGQNVLRLSVGTRAQPLVWTIGPTDDMGRPATPFRTGRISVVPAGFDHYRLIPETRVVPTDGARRVRIAVTGSDRFGNDRPVRAMVLSVATDNGGRANVQKGRDGGCVISLDCSDIPLTTHTVVLADESGVTGTCTVRTIGFRKSAVAISRNGYLTIDGTSFLPLGGFYANWPSGLPDAEGRLSRSVDLFPCNTKPYPHGHPWPEDVESKVNDYLDLCRKHGVTTLRLMLRNMDIVGRVDPVQLQATLHLFDLARERDIRFDVALFEDYGKPPYCNADIIDTIALPHYTPDDLANLPDHRARFLVRKDILASPAGRYRDPDAIRCQKEYLDELIPVLAGREEVFCYEFENEMVRPPMSWCRDIAAHIRTIDPHTPVLGNPGPHDWPEPWRWRDSTCDLFCYHP
ncbi:MAG: hypothetical protein HON70_13830, partial [Lentisphaerae bacterium]|nr:hypothetical protein [Lentisphaerota bacterium]